MIRIIGYSLIMLLPVATALESPALANPAPESPVSPRSQTQAYDRLYVRDIISLSHNLGKAHAVRVICNGRTDQHWRRYMHRLLEIEAPTTGPLRNRMIRAFNTGFTKIGAGNPICDDAIRESEKRFAAEGVTLSARLAQANLPQNRLGGPSDHKPDQPDQNVSGEP